MTKRKPPASAWKPGQSGNPAGKPKGTKHRATQLVLHMMEGDAEAITRSVIDAAKGGDITAARIIIERLAPPLRERPVSLDLPEMADAGGIAEAQQAILRAVGEGELLPTEGATLSGIVEQRRRALETQELEQRITALEAKAK